MCEIIVGDDLLTVLHLLFLPFDGFLLFRGLRTGLMKVIPVVCIDGFLIQLLHTAGDLISQGRIETLRHDKLGEQLPHLLKEGHSAVRIDSAGPVYGFPEDTVQ